MGRKTTENEQHFIYEGLWKIFCLHTHIQTQTQEKVYTFMISSVHLLTPILKPWI